jgi:regulatory protein
MDEFEKNYNRALRFLSYRVRSEKEIRDYLESKIQNSEFKIKEEIINAIVEKLKRYHFINDEEFARIWIQSRTKLKPRALRVIQYELKQKGITEEIINSQLSMIKDSRSEESGQNLDLESAKVLVKRKISKYKDLSKHEIYEKLGRFLAGKGFNWDVIKKSIDEISKS